MEAEMTGYRTILSIDGGGIRGIIPARILAFIEQETKKRICELFDLVIGTTTGGILALGLTKPSPKWPYEANDLIDFYRCKGPKMFPAPGRLEQLIRRLVPAKLRDLRFRPKYDHRNVERILRDKL